MEYYSTLQTLQRILFNLTPLVTMEMNLEGSALSEENQSQKGKHCTSYLKYQTQKQRIEWWLPGTGKRDKLGTFVQWM